MRQQYIQRKCIVECNFDLLPLGREDDDVKNTQPKKNLRVPPLSSQQQQKETVEPDRKQQQSTSLLPPPPRRGLKRSDHTTIHPAKSKSSPERINLMEQKQMQFECGCSDSIMSSVTMQTITETSACGSFSSFYGFECNNHSSSSFVIDSIPSIPTRTWSPQQQRRKRYHCSFDATNDVVPVSERRR